MCPLASSRGSPVVVASNRVSSSPSSSRPQSASSVRSSSSISHHYNQYRNNTSIQSAAVSLSSVLPGGSIINGIPKANFSAGRKTVLNATQEKDKPRKRPNVSNESSKELVNEVRRKARCGTHCNEESKTPPPRLMRKRPQSASVYQPRNVVVDPPDTSGVHRRRLVTPTRERTTTESDHTCDNANEDLNVKSILTFDPSSLSKDDQKKVSDFGKVGKKQNSSMALRSSFEQSSLVNVKVCMILTLICTYFSNCATYNPVITNQL
ncbi:hypothetical protein C9374_013015 [Naegleria lovaniensis]|uniref:Uncharacterized protein n=1 Tax=Naegleria lovaniensis TaxID=51637 RepID=A0AA88GCA1_NAELO|nr:uncharacterized protein C9374_013015 [Naegleria lovaniensis]KAG2372893.1 hypothetical protein C9374_013015 [Naegleria lovaniensis]